MTDDRGRVCRPLRDRPVLAAIVVVAQTTATATLLAGPAAAARAIDTIAAGRPAGPAIAVVGALMAAGLVATTIGRFTAAWRTASVIKRARDTALRRLVAAGPGGRQSIPAGDMASRVNVDIPAIAGMLTMAMTVTLGVLSAAVAIAALFRLDWSIGLAFLLVAPPAFMVVRKFMADSRDLYRRYRQAQDGIAGRLVDAVAGARTICVSGTTRRELARVTAGLPELEGAGRRLWAIQRTMVASATMLLPAVLFAVLLAAGLSLHAGRIGPGGLVAAGAYAVIALGVLDVADSLAALSQLHVSGSRVAELMACSPVRYGSQRLLGTAPPTVALHQVTIRDGTRTILDRLTVLLPAGSRTALVGPSGSGKSTAAAVIGRLRDPDQGQATLNGVPVTALTAGELRRVIAYAFDRPARLGRTLRDLVGLGIPGLDAGRLAAAARTARADGFVARLPRGWDTPVRHAPLSGGEWQRLGLTRAVARSAAVVILDDATSSLDAATEASVLAAIDDIAAGRTVIAVAHQPAVAAWADQVVWLEAGRVRAMGPHEQLWTDPEYRAIFLGAPAAVANASGRSDR